MVKTDELIKRLNDPESVARAIKEARQIAIIAEAQYRCTINDYNNELYAKFCRKMSDNRFSRGY